MEETDIKYTMIQMVEGEPEKEGHDLEEPFDEEFWLKVEEKFAMRPEISWNRAMDEVRIERLMSKHGMNTLVIIICVWPASENYEGKPELVASLEYLKLVQ